MQTHPDQEFFISSSQHNALQETQDNLGLSVPLMYDSSDQGTD